MVRREEGIGISLLESVVEFPSSSIIFAGSVLANLNGEKIEGVSALFYNIVTDNESIRIGIFGKNKLCRTFRQVNYEPLIEVHQFAKPLPSYETLVRRLPQYNQGVVPVILMEDSNILELIKDEDIYIPTPTDEFNRVLDCYGSMILKIENAGPDYLEGMKRLRERYDLTLKDISKRIATGQTIGLIELERLKRIRDSLTFVALQVI